MRLRHILSGLLVMLLMGGSSWATACDLSCGLERAMAQCGDSAKVAAKAPAVMAMEHCHGMAMHTAVQRVAQESAMSADCPPMDCGHQILPAVHAGKDGSAFLWHASEPVVANVLLDAPLVHRSTMALAVPRGDPYGFNPLLVSLRI